jgi:voltage-gated potassium channel Kch
MNQISPMALLVIGTITTLFNVLVHSLLPPTIVKGVLRHIARGRGGIWIWDVVLIMEFTVLALAAHFIEIALWALSFFLCGEFSNFAAALSYSGSTYTTLGDSATVLSPRWRMLGPIEAANGLLMFGVSTAIIFAVILRLIESKFGLQRDPPPKIG